MKEKNFAAFCHARLPNAGLGNKLFVWAKALCFARLNNLPLVVSGWTQFQLAPILHGGDCRLYLNYFRPVREAGFLERRRLNRTGEVVVEPPVARLDPATAGKLAIYEYRAVPPWADYFGDLKPHRELVRRELLALLTSARRKEYEKMPKPRVCLQVRMVISVPSNRGRISPKSAMSARPWVILSTSLRAFAPCMDPACPSWLSVTGAGRNCASC